MLPVFYQKLLELNEAITLSLTDSVFFVEYRDIHSNLTALYTLTHFIYNGGHEMALMIYGQAADLLGTGHCTDLTVL